MNATPRGGEATAQLPSTRHKSGSTMLALVAEQQRARAKLLRLQLRARAPSPVGSFEALVTAALEAKTSLAFLRAEQAEALAGASMSRPEEASHSAE